MKNPFKETCKICGDRKWLQKVILCCPECRRWILENSNLKNTATDDQKLLEAVEKARKLAFEEAEAIIRARQAR